VRAQLKSLHSPDVADLAGWAPGKAVFSLSLQAMIGPSHEESAESFDILVCSPAWLAREMSGISILSGTHKLIMNRYDYRVLRGYLERRVAAVEAPTWPELARQLGSLGRWEFDGYSPFVHSGS